MNITVTVDALALDTLIGKAYGFDEDGDAFPLAKEATLGTLVAAQIVDRLIKDDQYPQLRNQVMEIRKEEIRAAIRPAIDEAVARPIRKTNSWGESTGEETTLTSLIMEDVRKYLGESADSYGNIRTTVLQKMIREQVAIAFKDEVTAAVKAAKDAVAAEIGGQLGAQVADAVRKGITAR